MSDLPRGLTDGLAVAMFPILYGFTLMLLAYYMTNWRWYNRVVAVGFGMALAFFPALFFLITFGWGKFTAGATEWWELRGFGSIVASCAYVGLFGSFIIGTLTLWGISRQPSFRQQMYHP